jgi:hypothetical protein
MKRISDGGAYTRPFITHKSFLSNYTHLSASNDIRIDEATDLDIATFNGNTAPRNQTGIIQSLLGKSITNLFYACGSNAFPLNVVSPKSVNLPCYVLNIPQRMYGDEVKAGSLRIFDTTSNYNLIDGGDSNLIVSGTNIVVGNIFYKHGIAVIKKSSTVLASESFYTPSYFTKTYFNSYFQNVTITSASIKPTINIDGLHLVDSRSLTVTFNSTFTIYENSYICTVEPGEFNFSVNPSMNSKTLSGSFFGPEFIPSEGPTAVSELFSGSLSPYFTQIGLYNDTYELLAIAKVPRAIKRLATTQQTVIVRFDA